jgi:NAD(P)-dependent dehydrogenase (short-subunit alcohol dehydrogenase family)
MELAEHGIRMNAVSPAVVVMPIYGAFMPPEQTETALTTGDRPQSVTGGPRE